MIGRQLPDSVGDDKESGSKAKLVWRADQVHVKRYLLASMAEEGGKVEL